MKYQDGTYQHHFKGLLYCATIFCILIGVLLLVQEGIFTEKVSLTIDSMISLISVGLVAWTTYRAARRL